MVNTKKNPLYKAESRIEAESWIDSTGKKKFPGEKLIVHRQGEQWHVYTG